MNELDFPIRVLERGPDDLCILIPHEDNFAWGQTKVVEKEKRDKTRNFCNWIRKQFPHIPTEFRFVNKKQVRIRGRSYWGIQRTRTVNSDKHFVAYGLKRSELMMIKLSWQFRTQRARYDLNPKDHKEGDFLISNSRPFEPSDSLKKRLEAKTKAKPVKL